MDADVLSRKGYNTTIPELELEMKMKFYENHIMLILGSIGNILTMIVFSQPGLKTSPISLGFICLALADTTYIWTELLLTVIEFHTGLYIITLNNTTCILYSYFIYLSRMYSAWVLSFISVERLSAVIFPHKAKLIFGSTRSRCIMFMLLLVCSSMNVSHIVCGCLVIIYNDNGIELSRFCGYNDNFYQMFIWPWIDFAFYSIIPFIVMITCNSIIITKITRSKIKRHSMTEINKQMQKSQTSSVTFMLISVSLTFILLTAPSRIVTLIGYTDENYYRWRLFFVGTVFLIHINHSVNFLLYSISGSKFREELVWLFCRKRKYAQHSQSGRSQPASVSERF